MRFKNLMTVTSLLLTAYFSLATSKATNDALTAPVTGNYYVMSDCSVPANEAVVTASGGTVIAPPGVNFMQFGFPAATLNRTMTGVVGGLLRECTVTYGEDGSNDVKDRWLYSCFDNGQFKCSIYVQPQ